MDKLTPKQKAFADNYIENGGNIVRKENFMAGFISRQPNGLLCRFSSVVDTITHYNMTEEEYIEMCAERAREEAREVLKKYLKPFSWVGDCFEPNNMSKEEFDKIQEEMSLPAEQCAQTEI